MTIDLRISPGNAGHLLFTERSVRGKTATKAFLETGTEEVVSVAKKAVRIGRGTAEAACGFFAFGIAAVFKTILKDHTAADFMAGLGMVAGAILAFFGLKDLITFMRESKKDSTPQESTLLRVGDESFEQECRDAEHEVLALDSKFGEKLDPINPGLIRSNTKNDDLTSKVLSLSEKYADGRILGIYSSYVAGPQPKIGEISLSGPISLSELKDRNAYLIGYLAGVGEFITDQNFLSNYENCLPKDFANTYRIADWCREEHLGNNDSLTTIIINPTPDLECLQEGKGDETSRAEAKEYITKLKNAEAYFKALKGVIDYVRKDTSGLSADRARTPLILRQALICGLRLNGDNLERINDSLLLVSNEIGQKLKTLEDHFNAHVKPKIEDSKSQYEIRSNNLNDEVLNGEFFYEVAQKGS